MNINYLFLTVVVLFIYMIVRGYKTGFLRMMVTFIGVIIILMAVKRVAPYVSDYLINNTKTYQVIQEKITEKFAEANKKYDNSIPENQTLTINSYDVPEIVKSNLITNNTKEMYSMLLVSIFEEYVSAYLAKIVVNAISFIVLFILFYILYKILLVFVDIISKIPIIKGVNKLAGGCIGFIESLLIVWVFFIIVVVFIGNDTATKIFKMVEDSYLLSVLFNSNIFIGSIL